MKQATPRSSSLLPKVVDDGGMGLSFMVGSKVIENSNSAWGVNTWHQRPLDNNSNPGYTKVQALHNGLFPWHWMLSDNNS